MGLYNFLFPRKASYVALGALLGYLLSQLMHTEKPILIGYVSQEEIMELERARIGSISSTESKQMLLDQPKKAADLMENIALGYESKTMRVVFSSGKVYGHDMKSISKDVYDEVIQKLDERLQDLEGEEK